MQRTSSHKCVTIVTPITKRMGFFVRRRSQRKARLAKCTFSRKIMVKTKEKCWIVQLSRLLDLENTFFYLFGIKVSKYFTKLIGFLSDGKKDLQNALFHAKSWWKGKKNVELNWKPNRKKIILQWTQTQVNIVLWKVDYKSYFLLNSVINKETWFFLDLPELFLVSKL